MPFSDYSFNLPSLDRAIDRQPITVSPDTLLADVFVMMGSTSNMAEETLFATSDDRLASSKINSSCVLVMATGQILGVFTQRDAVRALASGTLDQQQVQIAQVMTKSAIALKIAEGQDIFTPLLFFRQHNIRHLPILDRNGDELLGIVTPKDILQTLQPNNLFKLGTVGEVMNPQVVYASRTTSLLSIAQLMLEQKVSCVVVTDGRESRGEKDAVPIGIITEKKILQALALGKDLATTPAFSAMRCLGYQLNPTNSLLTAYHQMLECDGDTLLVFSDRKDSRTVRLGIITEIELLRALEPGPIYQRLKRAQQSVHQLQAEKTALLQRRNAELEQEVQQRTAQLRSVLSQVEQQAKQAATINQIVQAMRGSLVLDEVLQTTADRLHEALNVSFCLIYRPDSAGSFSVQYASENTPDRDNFIGIKCDFCTYYHSDLVHGKELILNQINGNIPLELQQKKELLDIHSMLIVPLIYGDSYLGGISLSECGKERQWTADEVEFVKAIADHCAIAIHQAELYQQLQAVLDAVPGFVSWMNSEGEYLGVNRRLAQAYNLPPEAFVGKKIGFFTSKSQYVDFITDFLAKPDRRDDRVIDSQVNGKKHSHLIVAQKYQQNMATVTVGIDITDRKQAEEALQEREALLETVVSNAPIVLYALNKEGVFTFIAGKGLKCLGLQPKDVVGRSVFEDGWEYPLISENNPPVLSGEELFWIANYQDRVFDNRARPLFDENGEVKGAIGVAWDITEQKRTQAERDRFFNNSMDLMAIADFQGILRLVNAAWSKNLGFTKEELEGKHYTDFIHPDDLHSSLYIMEEAIALGEPLVGLENRFLGKNGCYRWLSWNMVLFPAENLAYTFARDITERKLAEASLQASEARFRSLSECSPVGIFMSDGDRRFIYTNPRCQAICGFTFREALGEDWAQFIHPDEREILYQNWSQYAHTKQEYCYEHRWLHKDGTPNWVQVRTTPLFLNNERAIVYVGTIQDITESKQAQEKIKASLQEKVVLLKEVHHRVKNNLQIIFSLLDLQSQQIQGKNQPLEKASFLEIFQASKNRVKCMALIHERLYQSENMALINFADYIETLTHYLLQAYAITPDKINLILNLDRQACLNIDTAIPCGLIINELVGNALKHAFPENGGGTIMVEFKCLGENQFYLRIQDNGITAPDLSEWQSQSHLGFKLVNILVRQVDGELEIKQNLGSAFTIKFKNLKY